MKHMSNFKTSVIKLIVLSCLIVAVFSNTVNAQEMDKGIDKLAVLWVSGDRDVAEKS